ncbi:MAG: polyprenol monophosphomannose synthase [Dehalococcoidia bacterium]|nr:polyprenol monophosphomannose synthase [Dehalococcoidia bacterium]
MKVVIVVPTYNEKSNLQRITEALLALPSAVSVLVVDDNSPDGTGQLADQLAAAAEGRLHVLHRAGRRGLGAAYGAGFRHALDRGADRIFTMDADFSHPPETIPRMLELSKHCDVVVGSRYVEGGAVDKRWNLWRRLLSRGGNAYARWVTGIGVHDTTAGFKCFRASALRRLPLERIRSQGYVFQIELAVACERASLRVCEEPIYFRERDFGESKMQLPIVWEALWRVWQLRHSSLLSYDEQRR